MNRKSNPNYAHIKTSILECYLSVLEWVMFRDGLIFSRLSFQTKKTVVLMKKKTEFEKKKSEKPFFLLFFFQFFTLIIVLQAIYIDYSILDAYLKSIPRLFIPYKCIFHKS